MSECDESGHLWQHEQQWAGAMCLRCGQKVKREGSDEMADMPNITECNAVVESTLLGVEDHGMLVCFVHLDKANYGHQGFGGYNLAFKCDEFIRAVLDTLGVRKWEDLPGTHCRCRWELGKVHEIGHFMEDKWFSPAELYREGGEA